MARMSIDDKFLRDPRVTQLAIDLGMSRWEAMGRLIAVFAVCYDLEREVITPAQVDLAADRPGLADALFAADLAVTTRRGLRIRGVKKRIEYLSPKREAGRQGGIKSGESRRNSAKQKHAILEATVNPPDPVPDVVPDPVPEDQKAPSARAIPPTGVPTAVPSPKPAPSPALSSPPPARQDIAGTYDPDDARARGRLAEATYQRVSEARVAISAELKLPDQLPFPPITPSTRPRAFVELLDRVREESDAAPAACARVVASLIAQARATRDVEWLSQKAFSAGAWATARERIPGKRAKVDRYGKAEPAPAPRPEFRDPLPARAPVNELLAELELSRAVLYGGASAARAGPNSAETGDEEPERQPKPAKAAQ